MKRILYIQHAGALGGSCISLLMALRSLDRTKYEPSLALIRPSPEVDDFYRREGFSPLPWPGIATVEHTTLCHTDAWKPSTWPPAAHSAARWAESERRTLDLVSHLSPDSVHLNSAVLVPSARALWSTRVPFVWHVREMPVHGMFGLRTAALQRALLAWPDDLIFLSPSARREWVGDVRGRVITNCVDLARFDAALSRDDARASLGVPANAKVVLYLGGPTVVKGILVLLEALASLRGSVPGLLCRMPGATGRNSEALPARLARFVLPLLGSATRSQRVPKRIRELQMESHFCLLPFSTNVSLEYAAADVVVFPAVEDHFARPAIEAAAMARPVVGSRLPSLQDVVQHDITGLLVPHADPQALARALESVLLDPSRARAMGQAARALAESRFSLQAHGLALGNTYHDVLRSRGSL